MGAKAPRAATASKTPATPAGKNKGGRPELHFTDENFRQACTMASHGLTVAQIANVLGISKKTLERRIAERNAQREAQTGEAGYDALQAARDQAIAMVSQSLYRQAVGYERPVTRHPNGTPAKVEQVAPNFRATQFYLNVRAGWVETKQLDLANAGDREFTVAVVDYRGKKP